VSSCSGLRTEIRVKIENELIMERVRKDYLEAMRKKVDSIEKDIFDADDEKAWNEYMKEQDEFWKARNEKYRGYKNF